MKERLQTTVRVVGSGDSKQKAFALALGSVQQTILKNNQNIILRIEPLDVEVIEAVKTVKKETFLFFFLPRQRETYRIVLDVLVDITMIDLTKVDIK